LFSFEFAELKRRDQRGRNQRQHGAREARELLPRRRGGQHSAPPLGGGELQEGGHVPHPQGLRRLEGAGPGDVREATPPRLQARRGGVREAAPRGRQRDHGGPH